MNKDNEFFPKPGERVPSAVKHITACDNLLDIGCGDGILAHFVKNKVKAIFGVDNSQGSLLAAKKRGMITKQVDLDLEKLPFNNNYFDIITCLDVIEHVKNPHALLSGIYRVLKPKGKLIISTPNIRFSDHLYKLIIKGKFPKTSIDTSLYDGGHIHFFTFKDLEVLLSLQKFIIIEIDGIINKIQRGWKGRLVERIFGKKFMLEFRTPGILIIARKL